MGLVFNIFDIWYF